MALAITMCLCAGINDICGGQQAPHEADGRRCKRRNNTDWIWLQACLGEWAAANLAPTAGLRRGNGLPVAGVVEGDARCVEAYLAMGGDPARALTPQEVALLNRASAFDAGHTLVHLAIR